MTTPAPDRAKVVQALNDAFIIPALPVDPSQLSSQQQYSLLLTQLRHRARRFYVVSVLALAVFVGTLLVIFRGKLMTIGESGEPSDRTGTVTSSRIGYTPSCEIGLTPGTVRDGEYSLLDWSSENARTVTIEPEVGAVAPQGKMKIWPKKSTTYTVTAISANGEAAHASASIVVGESNDPNGPPVGSFIATPDTISRGAFTHLRWNSFNSTAVTITPDVGPVASSGDVLVSPRITTTYVLTITNAQGDSSRGTATIYVR